MKTENTEKRCKRLAYLQLKTGSRGEQLALLCLKLKCASFTKVQLCIYKWTPDFLALCQCVRANMHMIHSALGAATLLCVVCECCTCH